MGVFDKIRQQSDKIKQDYQTDKTIKVKLKAKELEDEKAKIKRKYSGAGLTDSEIERIAKKEKSAKKIDNIMGNFAGAAGTMSGSAPKPKRRSSPAPAKKKTTSRKKKRTSSRKVKNDTFGFNF
jgi:hypothetical protein